MVAQMVCIPQSSIGVGLITKLVDSGTVVHVILLLL